jgi:hypothetical protein
VQLAVVNVRSTGPVLALGSNVVGRSYTDKDLKIMWGVHATPDSPQAVIGKICHIVAHSDIGPRGDPGYPPEKREDPENLILMCGTHHDVIDVQPNDYTTADLRRWKRERDEWFETRLSDAVVALTFAELDQVTTGLISTPPGAEGSLNPPTPPQRKMRHNGLSPQIAQFYQVGQLRFGDIEAYIAQAHDWNSEFGERLTAGFREQYATLWDRGLRGDDLYVGLADGVAIVSYLFHTCDVFEREPDA